MFQGKSFQKSNVQSPLIWKDVIIVEHASHSQYDALIDLSRNNAYLENGVICLASKGANFHGFKNRHWESPPGNIYLSAYFAPNQPIDNFGVGFMILAAVSVLDVLDSIPEIKNKAMIKWVNDVFIDNAKVCGFLAYTQSEGNKVTGVVIGIGLNVETTPEIEVTPFVPKVASLADYCNDKEFCNQEYVFTKLIKAIDKNYRTLIEGGYFQLIKSYRQRSLAIGREVDVCLDKPDSEIKVIANGLVTGIGDNLELHIKDFSQPITKGRLILKN
jgi:BirA family biotin operon repressor/biotin-[acetyl-CoA-carboxylase] ligase